LEGEEVVISPLRPQMKVLVRPAFRRMFIAQALVEGLAVLTGDRAFQKYDVKVVW
jgi:PIN domain nuclease of toxin-antitoxin system